jgi:hypothetical protein
VTDTLVIAVSPYHLTTREAPAVAALQLADEVVTLLPAPASGRSRDDVRRAVGKSPRYLRLMESWRWTMPLWHAGVLGSAHQTDDVSLELRSFYERIGAEDEYAGLRPLTRHAAAATPEQFLDLLSGDILKGGPDPGLNIPVSAAIDDFAARHGIVVARAAAASVAQRAEARIGRRAFAVALPVLTRASARLILVMREELEPELAALRRALLAACDAASAGPLDPPLLERLARAAHVYTVAFTSLRERLAGRDDDEGVRITSGYVGVVGQVLPADVAMRSGLAAARAMNMRTPGAPAGPQGPGAPKTTTTPEPLVVLVVKPLIAEPDVRPL